MWRTKWKNPTSESDILEEGYETRVFSWLVRPVCRLLQGLQFWGHAGEGTYFFLSVLLFWVLETTVTQILAVIVHPVGTCGRSETSGYRPISMDGEKEKSMKQWSMRPVVPWSLFLYCLPTKNYLWSLPLWAGLRWVIKGRELLAFERKAWDITTRQQRLAVFPYWNVFLVYLIIHTQHSEMTEKWTHVALWSSVMRK